MSKRALALKTTTAAALLGLTCGAHAADHLDAPGVMSDGSLDINDLYAFQSPTNPDNSVLILTVNPGAGAISGTDFSSTGLYQLQIDNNGDALPDITYEATFGAPVAGGQAFSLTRTEGAVTTALAAGTTGTDAPVAGGGTVRADIFEDPFFFDLNGFNDGFNFTGDDFFAGLDVSAIVLEIPSADFGATNVAINSRTEDGSGNQFDRKGRPAINTALIAAGRKDDFNAGQPVDDPANFGAEVQAAIESLNGGDTAGAMSLTDVLLPDLLTYDSSDPSGFLNGRGLADDVIDAELGLLTNGGLTTDMVNANDVAFLNVFPFLAPANIPEPTSVALLGLGLAALAGRRRREA